MFKKLLRYLELQLLILEKQLELLQKPSKLDAKEQWDLKTGEQFNDLINKYAISEDELLSISETVCKFVTMTRVVNLDKYLFKDKEKEHPRLPFEIK